MEIQLQMPKTKVRVCNQTDNKSTKVNKNILFKFVNIVMYPRFPVSVRSVAVK